MSKPVHVALDVVINAPVSAVFTAFSQWSEQGRWMLGTHVEVTKGDGASVGSELSAFTGLGPAGFLDTMTIRSPGAVGLATCPPGLPQWGKAFASGLRAPC